MSYRQPKISVIMSVFNGKQYMRKGIQSVLNQSFDDFEFIICDDGSTDGTWKELQGIAEEDRRIILIRNENNKGLAYSLNRCIDIAKSEILARQDADDESDLRRFAIQYPYVLSHPEFAIIGTSWWNVDENGNMKQFHPIPDPAAKDMIWDGGFMHPSWMMRKSIILSVGGYTEGELTRRDQDYHLVLKLYGAGYKMHNMEEPLYLYTNDSNTFKRTKNWKRVRGLMWIRWDGYKRNHFPFWAYIAVLKPLVKNLLPQFITKWYYLRSQNG